MNCGDRRLIILASALIAVAVVALVALLAVKEKPIPTESWMVITGVVAMFGGIFSHRQATTTQKEKEENKDEQVN